MTGPEEVRRAVVELRPELVRKARTRLPLAAAEDLVHDTVARALTSAARFQPGTNARAWLHEIQRHLFLDGVRRRRVEVDTLPELAADPSTWVYPHREPTPERLALSPPVLRAIARLPRRFRAVVLQVDVAGDAYKEAAAELGIPVGTVMSRLHRGRHLLAAALGPQP